MFQGNIFVFLSASIHENSLCNTKSHYSSCTTLQSQARRLYFWAERSQIEENQEQNTASARNSHLVWLNIASQRPGLVESRRHRRTFHTFLQEEKSLLESLYLFRARIDEHLSSFLKNSLQPHKEEVYQVICCHCLKYCSPTHTSHVNNKNREV